MAPRVERKHPWALFLAVCLLAILLRWPSLEQPFDNDGGARAYHARLILAGEPLYSTHHTGHHLPGIYYTYALALTLFGDSGWSVKFLLILWTIPTLYCLYRLGLLLVNSATGLLAALFYAVLSAHVWLWGQTAETELFANLPRIAAVLVVLHLTHQRAPAWKYVFVGLLAAAAFLFKALYLSPLAMAGAVLLGEAWRNRQAAGVWRAAARRGLWVGIGFVCGLLPAGLYFSWLGLLSRLLLVFTLGQEYAAASDVIPEAIPVFGPWILHPLLPLLGLALNNAILLAFSLAGFLFVLLIGQYRSSPLLYLAAWYIFAWFEAGINLELFAHYYLLLVPPLSLLAAWFLLKLVGDVAARLARAGAWAATGLFLALLTLSLGVSIVQNYYYYYHYTQYKIGKETQADFVRQGWPGFGERIARASMLAAYVQERTEPADRIYYWSEDVQLYYLANRRSPLDTLWPIDVEATGSYRRIFVPQTRYVIVDRHREPAAPGWLYAALSHKYTLETVVDGQEIYRRIE